jgi:hypothetical protein
MPKWIACKGDFVTGDVVRWTEAVWAKDARRRRKKPLNVGKQLVTAEVLTEDGKGFVYLKVMKCEILSSLYAKELEPLKKDQIIKRKRVTVGKGGVERLKWSDESARALAVSRFMS